MNQKLTHATDCANFHRRDFIKVGVLGTLGLSMTDLFQLEAMAKSDQFQGKAKSVILIWLGGGPSHLDIWDLKPNAPEEIRGIFKPIKTNVPGIEICEHLPKIAQQMKKICLIRSMTSPEAAHERGTHYMMTGFRPLPGFAVPGYGSVVAELKGQTSALPPYIAIPSPIAYGGGGFLGSALDPFSLDGNPASKNFRVHNLVAPNEITRHRFDRRKTLRESVDATFKKYESGSSRAVAADEFYTAAYNLISSADARAAFDLSKENGKLRDAYRRDRFGQSCLLARRLVEAGVRFTTVDLGGWDNHSNIFSSLSGRLSSFDQTVATLIHDLSDRGLLDSTLTLVMGEFGRTPVINRDGGRDHHSQVFSIMLAGGGIKGGQVIGSSDAYGEDPADLPVRPEDLSATIYHCLGIDYNQSLESPEGTRIVLSRGGKHIHQALI
ncbi:TPA: DUF1501 domain-containing protein [Candidatus Poribacteria bacterium]|nr:DUF1501 domain-containing protein [Candidatus Poribacteria bacterium]HIB90772.1 DUF1501 domain-containing protein [Candidatus Poribacteria bacterium]HIC00897.1 DUF1501 domain-containing protein [Candidatus Poribacteria bacterium]HIC17233.1 DUF1501 domain-containing protein [Candidatus Poribacteria bacterium]HIN31211.1 DUF1501 domain-containing protein [Candidatus Poribacteria bacterium]